MRQRSVGPLPVLRVLTLLAVVVLGQVEAWTVELEGSPRAVTVLAVLAATSALAVAHRAPALAAAVVVSALVVKDAFRGPGEVVVLLLCGVVTAFEVGLRLGSRRARVVLAGLLVLASVGVLVGEESAPSELVFSAIALGGPWTAGRLVRSSRRHAAVAEELAAVRAREAADAARWAAAEERRRIARELHDLVGHSVSLMVIQAGAAAEVLRGDPGRAEAVLASLQETGRGAVADLHRALDLLGDDDTADDRAALPGLAQLPALMARFREGGLDVAHEVHGDVGSLPPALSLTAYRVVQEALTNAVRHAPGADVRVRVRRGPDRLVLEVSDAGPRTGEVTPGHGLLGMRERVAMYGGRLEAGPCARGGFQVQAEIPLPSPS